MQREARGKRIPVECGKARGRRRARRPSHTTHIASAVALIGPLEEGIYGGMAVAPCTDSPPPLLALALHPGWASRGSEPISRGSGPISR